ncbi:hypothetical protein F4553_002396 [Allocatelliglobosispora scoriae]|uniref:Uncharacterized protein n=1 Tax=Allocatelliglobosispora scoriae TaxID=643052 RepID=A0A841BIS1_9ACTN|nr:hypothetical protein [Allocatelliglobosispora scoriae]MBB5869017.1 hypothetical protein [Allocatelliglobosispora scoriae]
MPERRRGPASRAPGMLLVEARTASSSPAWRTTSPPPAPSNATAASSKASATLRTAGVRRY